MKNQIIYPVPFNRSTRRIKGVVSSMNKNQSNIGGVVGTAENGVEALRFLAEVTRGTEKRRERTAHLF